MKKLCVLSYLLLFFCCHNAEEKNARAPSFQAGKLQVSRNGRFLQQENGQPFFWLGDTAWLLVQKLDRDEVRIYLQDRRDKGFNVIQMMLIHELPEKNDYGDSPFIDNDPARPDTTPGNDPNDPLEYDYWDHVDYIADQAAAAGIYLGMVVAWGSVVKSDFLTVDNAEIYASWLAERYKGRPNIIWITGGDIRGDDHPQVWRLIGATLKKKDPNHLITFHPFGRTQSSTWFHHEAWLDFNMFQSGHRRYDQMRPGDDPATWKGEDNWKYVREDYALLPVKPTLDGEPSYENIPQGLHDPSEPYWTDADARRYAYWSVFAGACGYTYGDNAVMQMHKPGEGPGAYGVRNYWYEAIHDPGAGQMHYLKSLMLSRPYFERRPDQSLVAGENGQKYDYVIATCGKSYDFFYTYTGREFDVMMGKISGKQTKAWWYDPRTGDCSEIGILENSGIRHFDPPGEPQPGNDWVLVLDDVDKNFGTPGESGGE
jgi:hypothetical protein